MFNTPNFSEHVYRLSYTIVATDTDMAEKSSIKFIHIHVQFPHLFSFFHSSSCCRMAICLCSLARSSCSTSRFTFCHFCTKDDTPFFFRDRPPLPSWVFTIKNTDKQYVFCLSNPSFHHTHKNCYDLTNDLFVMLKKQMKAIKKGESLKQVFMLLTEA